MAFTREQKQNQIKDIKERISSQKSLIFADFSKVSSKNMFSLRKSLKQEGCNIKIVKKTLARIAMGQSSISFWSKIKEVVPGQLALIFGIEDEVAPARISNKFAKDNENFKILGGIFPAQGGPASGWQFIEREKVLALANLPSKQELLSKMVGSMASPMSGFMNVLQGNISGLVRVLSKIKK